MLPVAISNLADASCSSSSSSNNNNNNNNNDNASARHLLADLGRKEISINTGEARETSYLFQRISVSVQRFNAVLLHDSLPAADSTD